MAEENRRTRRLEAQTRIRVVFAKVVVGSVARVRDRTESSFAFDDRGFRRGRRRSKEARVREVVAIGDDRCGDVQRRGVWMKGTRQRFNLARDDGVISRVDQVRQFSNRFYLRRVHLSQTSLKKNDSPEVASDGFCKNHGFRKRVATSQILLGQINDCKNFERNQAS